MAWETRNVKISALNDSKYIGISVYSVVITSASVVVIGTIISERATLAYISITSLILITTTSTLCLLFLPKIVAIRTKGKREKTGLIIIEYLLLFIFLYCSALGYIMRSS